MKSHDYANYFDAGSAGRILIHTVDAGNRLRLPLQTAEVVPWLKGEDTRKATMILGHHGGVQVWPNSFPITGRHELQEIQSALGDSPANPEETGTEWMRLMRFAMLRYEVEFKADGKHYSIGLPRLFRDMGTLPSSSQPAAIVISGAIIEIWRAEKLEAHARETRGKFLDVMELALTEFERRD
jgi:hypothetical protein